MFSRIAQFFKDLLTPNSISDQLQQKLINDPDDDTALKKASAITWKKRDRSVKKKSSKRWKNHLKNQIVEPLQRYKPKDLNTVNEMLKKALQNGLKVRAAGSGHSYSDVATTPDFFVNTHDLNQCANKHKPIVGQLRDEDLKPAWREEKMKSNWLSMADTPEIDFDTNMVDILKVRSIAENNTMLFETEAGIKIEDLNKELTKQGLGLPNMGGFDGQTIIGAISTSTHGSGISLGPFPNMVRSLVIATTGKWEGNIISGTPSSDGVNYYRIEPTDGITDADQYGANQSEYNYEGKDIQLIQDNDCFHAVIVSLGTMGVIYSLVMEVIQLYYLTETRQLNTLERTLSGLKPDHSDPGRIPEILRRYRNYEILVHPYPIEDKKVIEMDLSADPSTYYKDFITVETKRNITHPPEKDDDQDEDDESRDPLTKFAGKLKISFKVIAALLNSEPKLSPGIVTRAMKSLEDQNYVKKSFRIYNLGLAGDAGFANEIGFPLYDENGKFTMQYLEAAINTIHATAQKARINGLQYQTSPFSLRFVNSSPAYLSMMNRGMTAMIELDMVTGTEGGIETVTRIQEALYDKYGTPHWGLEFDNLNGNNNHLQKMYPNLQKWLKVYQQLNSEGTFDNKTTSRLGFSKFDTN